MSDTYAMPGPGPGGGHRQWRDHLPWMAMAGGRRGGPRHPFGPGGPPFGRGGPGGFPFPGGPFGGLGGWGHGWGGFGRPQRARRGDVRAAALSLLAEQPRNGYQIIQEIAERSGGVWRPSPGSVYPALSQLEDEGLIRSESTGGRRAFQLTEEGQAYVEQHQDELAAAWEPFGESVSDDVVGLRELLAQVGIAMMQVLHAGTDTQVDQAKRVLDSTRRELYRILADGEGNSPSQDAPDEEPPGSR